MKSQDSYKVGAAAGGLGTSSRHSLCKQVGVETRVASQEQQWADTSHRTGLFIR